MKTYAGDRTIDGIVVTVDDEPLDQRLDIRRFSENGFEWTYEGPESRQLALAMLAWFSRVGMSGQLVSIIAAHSVLTAPFAMAIIRLRLSQIDESLEAAAWNLGASEWHAMREIILPFCKPAIFSSLFLTAAVSFDEFTVSWFVSGLNKTLPVHVLEIVQGTIDPQVNAIGTLVFGVSITLVLISQALIFFRLQKAAT